MDAPTLRGQLDQPHGLRFNSREDAFNYSDKLVEDANRWFSRKRSFIPERYEDINVNIYIDILNVAGCHVGKFHLTAIPERFHVVDMEGSYVATTKANGLVGNRHDTQSPVNFVVSQLVQGPKGFIPSLVRLETHKIGADYFGDLCSFAREVLKGSGLCLTEGEFSVFRFRPSSENNRTVKNAVIKAGPKAIQNVKSDRRKFNGERVDFCLEKHSPRLKIVIAKHFVRSLFVEVPGDRFKLGSVSFRTIQQ